MNRLRALWWVKHYKEWDAMCQPLFSVKSLAMLCCSLTLKPWKGCCWEIPQKKEKKKSRSRCTGQANPNNTGLISAECKAPVPCHSISSGQEFSSAPCADKGQTDMQTYKWQPPTFKFPLWRIITPTVILHHLSAFHFTPGKSRGNSKESMNSNRQCSSGKN